MVEIQRVSKSFQKTVKDNTAEIKALADVNLSIRENEFISIIDPSGCGKTTLLKIIDGLIPHDSGQILINGNRVSAPGPDRAVVFQTFALLPWRTVLANVEFSLELRRVSKEERTSIARDYLKRVGLEEFEHHYPHELSGGMQQRAGLASVSRKPHDLTHGRTVRFRRFPNPPVAPRIAAGIVATRAEDRDLHHPQHG